MGNQQSISSNNHNDNQNTQVHLNNHLLIPHVSQKAKETPNCNEIKYDKSFSALGDRSEISSSDLMMKETNESIKSIDDVNMKMENFNNFNSQKEINTKNAHSNISNSNMNKNIIIKIVWNEGGDNVFISGNFGNWTQWFFMNKKDQHFEIVFDLIPDVYEFKFIVDNVWKCSKDYPTLIDEKGNLNNFLDLRYLIAKDHVDGFNLNKNLGINLNTFSNNSTQDSNLGNENRNSSGKGEIKHNNTQSNGKSIDFTVSNLINFNDQQSKNIQTNDNDGNLNRKQIKNKSNNIEIDGKNKSENSNDDSKSPINSTNSVKSEPLKNILKSPTKQSSYCELIPAKNQMNCDAPILPSDYFKLVNYQDLSNQLSIGNPDLIEKCETKIFSHNYTCFMKLSAPPHIYLNHLMTSSHNNSKNKFLRLSSISRFRDKFTTCIYYKPKEY